VFKTAQCDTSCFDISSHSLTSSFTASWLENYISYVKKLVSRVIGFAHNTEKWVTVACPAQ